MTKSFLMLLIAAVLSSYCFADSSEIADNQTQASETDQADNERLDPKTETHFSAGMLYYRDPETGELGMPPAGTMRAMQVDAMNFSHEGLEVQILPDGSKMVDLQGRFQMSSTVHQGPDGLVHQCSSQPHTHLATSHSVQQSSVREER